jgi:DNA polymerase IV (DinB-like DNA polymerase)
MKQRIIAHLDLDAFFASLEERETPWMAGKPVVVGSDPLEGQGRGVVSTANYLARAYGIRSALPISKAWQFSLDAARRGQPEAIFVTPDFRKYSKASRAVMEIIRKYSAVVEQASVDEAYIDLSNYKSFVQAEEVCCAIKNEIKTQERITASIGLGQNKLIAKIASDMQKPDGLTIILPEDSEKFLAPLSIRKIPGIGPKTEQSFNAQKIFKVEDLKKYSLAELEEMLGKWGTALYYKIRGLDDSAVSEEYEAKSIGEQETFLEDTLDFKTVMEKMEFLCQGVFRSFQASDFQSFKNVTITARFADFETKTRSHTLKKNEKTLKTIKVEAMRLLMPFFDSRENPRRKKIRLVGVRIERLA